MTNKMIQRAIRDAQALSIEYGRSYLMSNGSIYIPICTDYAVKLKKRQGYWVASIYENGNLVHS